MAQILPDSLLLALLHIGQLLLLQNPLQYTIATRLVQVQYFVSYDSIHALRWQMI